MSLKPKYNLSDCLCKIAYDSENITDDEWNKIYDYHSKSSYAKKAMLSCINTPPDILSKICIEKVLFKEHTFLALQHPMLPIETKTNFVIPSMRERDILGFIDEMTKENKYLPHNLVSYFTNTPHLSPEIKVAAYGLIDIHHPFYKLIEKGEIEKLEPQDDIETIISVLINNEKIPSNVREKLFNYGYDLQRLNNPPPQVVPSIVTSCLETLFNIQADINKNKLTIHIINNLFSKMIDNNSLTDEKDIGDIIYGYFSMPGTISKTNVTKLLTKTQNYELLKDIIDFNSEDPEILFATFSNPNCNAMYFREKAMSLIDDYILTGELGNGSELTQFRFLAQRTMLTPEQYKSILDTHNISLLDAISRSHCTPLDVLKELAETPHLGDRYQTQYLLNSIKEHIPLPVYNAIMNTIDNATIPHTYIDENQLYTENKINLPSVQLPIKLIGVDNLGIEYKNKLHFITNNPFGYAQFINSISGVIDKIEDKKSKRILTLIKHSIESTKATNDFKSNYSKNSIFKYNHQTQEYDINFARLYTDKDNQYFKSTLRTFSSEQIAYIKNCIITEMLHSDEYKKSMLDDFSRELMTICEEEYEKKLKEENLQNEHHQSIVKKEQKESDDITLLHNEDVSL